MKPSFSHTALPSFIGPPLNSSIFCSYWEHRNEGANAACLKRIAAEIKDKMSHCEGIFQSVLCQCADKKIKASALSVGLCFNSASQAFKSAVITAQIIPLQSAKINYYIRGFKYFFFFFKFWKLFILRDNHCYFSLTVELAYTRETKKTFSFTCLVFF